MTTTWRTSLVVLAVIATLIVLSFVAQKALS
jgi:hypothetical protein